MKRDEEMLEDEDTGSSPPSTTTMLDNARGQAD
jgi:hypothetical protein